MNSIASQDLGFKALNPKGHTDLLTPWRVVKPWCLHPLNSKLHTLSPIVIKPRTLNPPALSSLKAANNGPESNSQALLPPLVTLGPAASLSCSTKAVFRIESRTLQLKT